MKLYEANFKAIDGTKILLTQADVVEGINLTPDELKNTKDVLFWYIAVKSEEASRKTTYITFNVIEVKPFNYGDGEPVTYKIRVSLDIFTNKEDIRALITMINDKADDAGWDFDMLSPTDYEAQSKLYTHSFILEKVVG